MAKSKKKRPVKRRHEVPAVPLIFSDGSTATGPSVSFVQPLIQQPIPKSVFTLSQEPEQEPEIAAAILLPPSIEEQKTIVSDPVIEEPGPPVPDKPLKPKKPSKLDKTIVKRVNLSLSPEVYNWLKAKASKVGKSPTTFAGIVLTQMMMDDEKQK